MEVMLAKRTPAIMAIFLQLRLPVQSAKEAHRFAHHRNPALRNTFASAGSSKGTLHEIQQRRMISIRKVRNPAARRFVVSVLTPIAVVVTD